MDGGKFPKSFPRSNYQPLVVAPSERETDLLDFSQPIQQLLRRRAAAVVVQ